MNVSIFNRNLREWVSSFPIFVILLLVILLAVGENINAQINRLGNHLWSDYHLLRLDLVKPTCDPNIDVDARVNEILNASSDDPFGGIFDAPDPEATRQSVLNEKAICLEKHEAVVRVQAQMNDGVLVFRSVDRALSWLSQFSRDNQGNMLVLMVFICALTATLTYHHIGLRPMQTRMDHRVGATAQFIATSALAYSSYHYLNNGWLSGTVILNENIRWAYLIGFSMLALVTFVQIFRIPADAQPGGSFLKSLLSVPLYCYMAFSSANFYILSHNNAQGMVLFVDKIMDTSSIYLAVGLYIWVGMLLKQTFVGEYVFRIFKPWRLPPELLAFVAVVVMAVPTAYTGASGIILIAMGAVIYTELRRVGARRQLALAATAMSGSLGVVLRPCLLVLLIAVLNKEVTTDMMYGWGSKIFLLTAGLFFLVALIAKRGPMKVAPVSEALVPSLEAFKPLLPYVLVFVLVALFYAFGLNAHLDEHSAPYLLPVILLGFLMYERWMGEPMEKADDYHDNERAPNVEGSIRVATTNATVHIGALTMLMALGLTSGGVIEDSGIIQAATDQGNIFTNIWSAMAALVALLVFLGMIMDPFGAIILVSGTVAQAAYAQGIDPLHFWMIVLVAFELGYLSPPVAVNHLLTRQVVGEKEIELAKQEAAGGNFWVRHERYLLPLTVMTISLLLVAFGPLVYMRLL